MKPWSLACTIWMMCTAPFFSLPAQSCVSRCVPCCWDFCDRGLEASADFLWWKPCIDDLDFAYSFKTSKDETTIQYKEVCPDWEPGVRVQFSMPEFFCNWGLDASWIFIQSDEETHFEAPSGGDVSSPLLHSRLRAQLESAGSGGRFKEVHADWKLRYNEWDLILSYQICCGLCHDFSPFFGLSGIFLDQKMKIELENPEDVNSDDSGEIEWNSKYWGVGLKAGFDYRFDFSRCIAFFTHAEGILLAGGDHGRNEQEVFCGESESTFEFEIKNDRCCRIVPGYQLGAGFIYKVALCGCCFSTRIGYEFIDWYHLSNPRVFPLAGNDALVSHSTSSSERNVAFHGLFAGLNFSF